MARPITFKREAVLEKAMHLFWQRGYAATSMSDLAEVMDLRPGSIYAAFDSKQSLMLEAMALYAAAGRRQIQSILNGEGTVQDRFRNLFAAMSPNTGAEQRLQGCLIVNLMLELSRVDAAAADVARKHLQEVRECFHEALVVASRCGELNAEKDVNIQATFLMGVLLAIRVMGPARMDADDIESFYSEGISHVFG